MSLNERDVDVLARTIWGEARGRGLGRADRRGVEHPGRHHALELMIDPASDDKPIGCDTLTQTTTET